jgi:molybdopterin adenylyltransferase
VDPTTGSDRPSGGFTAVVVTASDGVSTGHRRDGSGAAVEEVLVDAGFTVTRREVVPDDRGRIATLLRDLADGGDTDLVAITGGTGFGPRDVTPEATADVIDRPAPGLAEAMRAAGRAVTPMADLSRGVCGVRGRTLVVDLPGSPKGATESLTAIIGLLPHALQLLAGDTRHHPPGHGDEGVARTSG